MTRRSAVDAFTNVFTGAWNEDVVIFDKSVKASISRKNEEIKLGVVCNVERILASYFLSELGTAWLIV